MSAEAPKPRQRQKSITKGDQAPAVPKRVYKSHLDRPIHAPRQPTLRWGTTLPPVNGFLNLAVVLALCGALAFIIGNINRHGIRVRPSYWLEALTVDGQISWAPLVLLLPLPFFAGGTFFIEKRIAAGVLDNFRGRICHAMWLLVLCIYPVVVMMIFGARIPFFPAFQAFMGYTALMMKMWSYAQTNRWCREKKALEKSEERDGAAAAQTQSTSAAQGAEQTPGIVYGKLEYPDNLTVKELAYFMMAPTLCYELNFPKTERRNYKAIAYRLVEFAVCMFTLFALVQQWLIPAHKRALLPYARGETMVFVEKMLITAIAQNIVWLLFFYTVFHSWCILLAEILCFADKKFYDTWWQAENLDAFWRKWNLPVHNWAVRHIYIPMLRRGYGKRFCQYAVFIFSGLFHEYVSSPPLRIMRGHFVLGFIFQIPLSDITLRIEKRYGYKLANSLIWLSLVIGQCGTFVFYLHDFIAVNFGAENIPELIAQHTAANS